MRAIATYIMRGRLQAILATTGLGLMALLLMPLTWPLTYLSSGAVALVTLVQGPKEGILNVTGAMVLVGLMTGLAFSQPAFGVVYAIIVWLPVWLLALVFYLSRSLQLVLLLNALMGLIFISAVYLIVSDPAGWWLNYFNELVLPAMEQAGFQVPDQAAFDEALTSATRLMTGTVVATTLVGFAISVLIGRWWQSVLYKPGAFAEEFQQLRLGYLSGVVVILIALLSMLSTGGIAEWSANLLLLGMSLFMFQGLAVSHALNKLKGNNPAWLVVMYVVIVFTFPYGLLMMAMIGLIDNGVDIRARFRNANT